jgi:hypothetical protein
MNDPHVVAVRYRLEPGEWMKYEPPKSALAFKRGEFEVTLYGQSVTLVPRAHFATRAAARAAAEPIIRTWELEASLELRVTGLRFVYESTELVDRLPTPGVIAVSAETTGGGIVSATGGVVRRVDEYPPEPHPDLLITPDVETLWKRYVGYREGREPLPAMAYFCFTVLTPGQNGRAAAASRLNVEETVLRKLGELSSTRGDLLSARKAASRPMTPLEADWLDTSVRKLILQLARSATGPPASRLSMTDLPALPERAS